MNRIIVALTFLVVAGALFIAAFLVDRTGRNFDLLLNLGTEIFGIVVTLAFVDWMLERRRRQERARELAWRTLHAIERAVWVWQGGPQRVDTDELIGLIGAIDPENEPQSFTRSLLIAVGAYSREALNREASALRSLKALPEALAELTTLSTLSERSTAVSIPMISDVLASAARSLALVLGQPTQPMPASLLRNRDPSPMAQGERYNQIHAAAERL